MRFVLLGAVIALTGCASMQARREAAESSDVRVTVRAPLPEARNRVVGAMMANSLPVTSTQDQLLEAKLPREDGFLGKYDLTVRAVLVAMGDSTMVTLMGEEHLTTETAGTTRNSSTRVSSYSKGRAAKVWERMNATAAALRTP